MNKYEIVEQKKNIEEMIYKIRDKQVMLDTDVAMLYGYEVKQLNRVVKRNIDRFPEYFCFRLTEEEYNNMRCQIGTAFIIQESKRNKRYLPLAFTEYGITMLAGLLKSDIAVEVSIRIINTFIEMKNFIRDNAGILNRLTNVEYKQLEQGKQIDKVFKILDSKKEVKEKIFFNGQIYDAYSLLVKIIKGARKDITIIDNYIDNTILDILSKKREKVDVLIVTNKSKCKLNNLDVEKFNKQYPKLNIKYNNNFHDRFIILDNNILYHCGTSIKDTGNKCSSINRIGDKQYITSINKELAKILV